MPDTLATITTFINSPPGVLVAGGVLAGIVWKAFEKWESVASENDKIQVWMWLAEPKSAEAVERWSETFAKMFDRVFGERHLSTKCFLRSALVSIALYGLCYLAAFLYHGGLVITDTYVSNTLGDWNLHTPVLVHIHINRFLPAFLTVAVIGDYLALLETRMALAIAVRFQTNLTLCVCLMVDALVTLYTASVITVTNVYIFAHNTGPMLNQYLFLIQTKDFVRWLWGMALGLDPGVTLTLDEKVLWFYPALFTSIWLWLYAGSGFLLKAARPFDKSLGWFNRRFDIEKHPLSSIGMVAGALVALIYWAAVIVDRML